MLAGLTCLSNSWSETLLEGNMLVIQNPLQQWSDMPPVKSYSSFSCFSQRSSSWLRFNQSQKPQRIQWNKLWEVRELPPCFASVSNISWINEAKQQRTKNAARVFLANQQPWFDWAQPEDSAASKGLPLQTNKQKIQVYWFFELSVNLPTNMPFIVTYHFVSNHIFKTRAFTLSLTIALLLTNPNQVLAVKELVSSRYRHSHKLMSLSVKNTVF